MHSITKFRDNLDSWFNESKGMQRAIKELQSLPEIVQKRIGATMHSLRPLVVPPLPMHVKRWLDLCQTHLKIPNSEWEPLVQYASLLLTPSHPSNSIEEHDVVCIIVSLRSIPENERKNFVQQIKLLFTGPLDLEHRVSIMEQLCQIPAIERANVVKHTIFLFPNADTIEKEFFIKELCRMPESERESITKFIQSIKSKADVSLRPIFQVLSQLPAQERASILELAKPFITRARVIHIITILDKLLKVPANERKNFAQLLNIFFSDSMDKVEIIRFFSQLSKISESEREKWAQFIAKNTIYKNHELILLYKLADVPESERESFMLQVKPLFNVSMPNALRKTFIAQVAALPNQQWELFIKQSLASLSIKRNFLEACVKNQEAQVPEPNPKEPTLGKILAAESKMIIPILPNIHPKQKEMLIKALKIKNYYNKIGYICFLHGQEPSRLVWQLLIKELAKIRNPEEHFKDPFIYFRTEKFYQQTRSQTKKMIDFKKSITDDHTQRNEVISVDAYFLNNTLMESANDFCRIKGSVHPLKDRGANDFIPVLENLNVLASVIKSEIDHLVMMTSQKMPCGNLYVICIPKDRVMDYSYPAHPLGHPCDCISEAQMLKLLVEANQDQRPMCYVGITQWRLMAAMLRPENGVRSFALSPKGDFKSFLEEHIKPLAAKISYLQIVSPKSRL